MSMIVNERTGRIFEMRADLALHPSKSAMVFLNIFKRGHVLNAQYCICKQFCFVFKSNIQSVGEASSYGTSILGNINNTNNKNITDHHRQPQQQQLSSSKSLGKPLSTKCAVSFNIVKKSFDPPSLRLGYLGCNFCVSANNKI